MDAIDSRRVAELAAEHGFADVADGLAALARWGYRLEVVDAEPALGATKLGGMPDLPAGTAWPLEPDGYAAAGTPMCFAGQIDTTALGEHWPGPPPGLLLLFCAKDPESDEVGGGCALTAAPGATLERAELPGDLPEANRLGEAAVVVRPELSVPAVGVDPALPLEPLGFDWEGRHGDEIEAYFQFMDALAAAQGLGLRPMHRVLGHPLHIQGDVMRELVGVSNTVSYEDTDRVSLDWRLLLQVDSDRRLGDHFADGGAIYFGAPEADLRGGTLDNVAATLQSG